MNEEYKEVKTRLDGRALFYGEYRGNSIGRAIHYLSSICWKYADSVTFCSGNLIKYYDREFATVDWSRGYPYFTFLGEFECFNKTQKQLLCLHTEIDNFTCLHCGYSTKYEYGYEKGRFKNPV